MMAMLVSGISFECVISHLCMLLFNCIIMNFWHNQCLNGVEIAPFLLWFFCSLVFPTFHPFPNEKLSQDIVCWSSTDIPSRQPWNQKMPRPLMECNGWRIFCVFLIFELVVHHLADSECYTQHQFSFVIDLVFSLLFHLLYLLCLYSLSEICVVHFCQTYNFGLVDL